MNDFLRFRTMMTPVLIQILFWISVLTSLSFSLALLIGIAAFAFREQSPFAFLLLIPGLAFVVIGPFLARIFCELIILSFRIYDTLVEIRDAKPRL